MFNNARAFLFENRNMRQTVIKNTFWLFSGQTIGRAIRAIIVIYAARVLGTAGFGIVSYALGIAIFFTLIADMGLSAVLTKAAVQYPEQKLHYFSTALIIKLFLIVLSFSAIMIIGPFITTIPEALPLLPIAALILIFDGLREFTIALVRAKEKMEWEAALTLFTNSIIVIIASIFLTIAPNPHSLLSAYALGGGIGFFITLWPLRYYMKNLFFHFERKLIQPIMAQAAPLIFAGILGGTMLNIDIVMIGWWRSAAEVGLYAAAQKPIQLVYGFAAIIGASMFPLFSRLIIQDKTKFKSVLRQTMRPVIIGSTALTTVSIILGTRIMTLLYGAPYTTAGLTFKILALTFIINIPIVIGFNILFAANKQKVFLWSSPLGALSNAGLNALFIPWWGIEGAALSTLLTQLITNAYLWKKIQEI